MKYFFFFLLIKLSGFITFLAVKWLKKKIHWVSSRAHSMLPQDLMNVTILWLSTKLHFGFTKATCVYHKSYQQEKWEFVSRVHILNLSLTFTLQPLGKAWNYLPFPQLLVKMQRRLGPLTFDISQRRQQETNSLTFQGKKPWQSTD